MRPTAAVPLLMAGVLAACTSGQQAERACTRIGCESGVEVFVENAPAAGFRVEASADDGTPGRVEECSPDTGCSGRVFLRDFTPAFFTLRVVAGPDTLSQTVRPDYATVQPNGAGCPPTCRQARVTIRLP